MLRTLMTATFVGGGVSHFILGQTRPQGYAVFGESALFRPLRKLWRSFVMPNIRPLTAILGVLEIAAGLGLASRGRAQRIAAAGVLGFFAFLLVLGSGWKTSNLAEDVAKNRLPIIVLAALTLPFVMRSDEVSLREAWSLLTRPR